MTEDERPTTRSFASCSALWVVPGRTRHESTSLPVTLRQTDTDRRFTGPLKLQGPFYRAYTWAQEKEEDEHETSQALSIFREDKAHQKPLLQDPKVCREPPTCRCSRGFSLSRESSTDLGRTKIPTPPPPPPLPPRLIPKPSVKKIPSPK